MTTSLYTVIKAERTAGAQPFLIHDIIAGIDQISTEFVFLSVEGPDIEFGYRSEMRMIQAIKDSGADMLYADYYKNVSDIIKPNPLITVQPGSVRNDFDFGSLVLFRTESLRKALASLPEYITHGAFYAVVLEFLAKGSITHLIEFMYTVTEIVSVGEEEKHFAYQKDDEQIRQKEYERIFTDFLKTTGAYLPAVDNSIEYCFSEFKTRASVIIPVLNREKTISAAISSVLSQKTDFPFNLIIIDNHSTDNTTECIESFNDNRIIHIIPENKGLGIGGCWDYAIRDPRCGMFAVQLDSDDMYSGENVLQTIIDKFTSTNCAMVIGSYRITDANLNPIPPGVIAHREWSEENGHNNALRINGLGAPRAFYTPILRKIGFPNTSYGEDYAVALRISREYRIERIYEVLYNCRRWDGNSDANLNIEKANRNNIYKDSIRTMEINARIQINKCKIK